MMQPVADWRRVLRHAWSIRLAALSVVFQLGEAILPHVQDYIPAGLFAGLSMLATTGALVARLTMQKEFADADK